MGLKMTKFNSNVFDINGKEVKLDDRLRLTFNKGKFNEHTAEFDVIWKDAAYMIRPVNYPNNTAFLGRIAHNVEIEIMQEI